MTETVSQDQITWLIGNLAPGDPFIGELIFDLTKRSLTENIRNTRLFIEESDEHFQILKRAGFELELVIIKAKMKGFDTLVRALSVMLATFEVAAEDMMANKALNEAKKIVNQ